MSRRVHLYIASSLDGYIAGPDESIDWLFTDADYGYTDFIAGIDTIVMGRKSYELALNFGDWPYPSGRESIVFTRGSRKPDARVRFTARSPREEIEELRGRSGGDIWLLGGGVLVQSFLEEGLVDTLQLGLHPTVLGGGIPLFPAGTPHTNFRLLSSTPWPSGLVMLNYEVLRSEREEKSGTQTSQR